MQINKCDWQRNGPCRETEGVQSIRLIIGWSPDGTGETPDYAFVDLCPKHQKETILWAVSAVMDKNFAKELIAFVTDPCGPARSGKREGA